LIKIKAGCPVFYTIRKQDLQVYAMTSPSDKAEVALEYPDKLYIGTFKQSARFDAHLDETGICSACTVLVRTTCANRSACISTTVCSPTFCAIWRRQQLAPGERSRPPRGASRRRAGPLFGAEAGNQGSGDETSGLTAKRKAASPHHGIAGAIDACLQGAAVCVRAMSI
jgi:hypothetical protein